MDNMIYQVTKTEGEYEHRVTNTLYVGTDKDKVISLMLEYKDKEIEDEDYDEYGDVLYINVTGWIDGVSVAEYIIFKDVFMEVKEADELDKKEKLKEKLRKEKIRKKIYKESVKENTEEWKKIQEEYKKDKEEYGEEYLKSLVAKYTQNN